MSNLPPSGEIPRGAIRFNTDSNKPELWDGSQWAEFQLSTPNLGQVLILNLVLVDFLVGGSNPLTPSDAELQSITLIFHQQEMQQDFGDLTSCYSFIPGCCQSSTQSILTFGGELGC